MVAFPSCILFHLVCWHRWKGVKKFGLKQCFRNWTKPSPSPPSNTEFRWVVCYVSLASARDYTRVVPASAGLACSVSCFVPNFIETSKQENVQIFAFMVLVRFRSFCSSGKLIFSYIQGLYRQVYIESATGIILSADLLLSS